MRDLKATISATVFPHKPGCKVCDALLDNPGLRLELIDRLSNGEVRTKLIAWLKSHGYDLSYENLTRHYNRHIKPYLEPMLEIRRQILAEQEAISDLSPDELSEALGTSLLRQVLSTVKRLNLELLVMRIEDPGDAIEFLDKATKLMRAVAEVQRAKTGASLNERMVELRELEILAKAGNLDALAARYVKGVLAQHPEAAEKIMAILRPLLAPTATAMVPRTPKPNVTAKPRTVRRSC